MAEYIEREALIKECKRIIGEMWNNKTAPVSWSHAYADFICTVERVPLADVAPVVHGQWIGVPLCGNDNCRCSKCGSWHNIHVNLHGEIMQKYCPNCGAKMNLED